VKITFVHILSTFIQLDYENKEVVAAHVESMLNTALSDTNETYELLNRCDASTSSVDVYKIATDELTKSMEIEEQIYATPCIEMDCGPLYCQPSDNEKKIYEEFKGKRFRKLCHKEIELVLAFMYHCGIILLDINMHSIVSFGEENQCATLVCYNACKDLYFLGRQTCFYSVFVAHLVDYIPRNFKDKTHNFICTSKDHYKTLT